MLALRHCAYLNTYDSITRVTSRGSLATPLDAQSRLGAGEILQVANREMGWCQATVDKDSFGDDVH